MHSLPSRPTQSDYVVLSGEPLATHEEIMEAWRVRTDARQRILAFEVASERPDVKALRAKWLPDGALIEPTEEAVREWIDSLPEALVSSSSHTGRVFEALPIWFEVPGGDENAQEELQQKLGLSTARDDLRHVTKALVSEFGWTESSTATWLILCDAQPQTPEFYAEMSWSEGGDEDGRPWNTWVRYVVPLEMASTRVAKEHEKLQAQYEGVWDIELPRRPTNRHNVELAVFVGLRNDGTRTWMDVLHEWNESHPDSTFEETRKGLHLFAKAARHTYKSIMGARHKLVWKTGDDSR